MKIDAIEVEPGVYSVIEGFLSHEVRFADGRAFVRGREVPAATEDETQMAVRQASGPVKLASPMPGKVIRLLVSPDQAVAAGQGILVVEAMKMQNELRTPRAGIVREIRVAAGATVAAAELLAIVE
jgi:biotin carboxyl carrier protein